MHCIYGHHPQILEDEVTREKISTANDDWSNAAAWLSSK